MLGFILAIAVNFGHSTELVIQQKPSLSRTLAGHALVRGTNEPLSGVTVELCNSDWKEVLITTKTDKNGYFSLEKPAIGKLYYIRLSAPGMNPYQLRVRIKMQAAQELTIHLSVAT
jgi:hypothetical protein